MHVLNFGPGKIIIYCEAMLRMHFNDISCERGARNSRITSPVTPPQKCPSPAASKPSRAKFAAASPRHGAGVARARTLSTSVWRVFPAVEPGLRVFIRDRGERSFSQSSVGFYNSIRDHHHSSSALRTDNIKCLWSECSKLFFLKTSDNIITFKATKVRLGQARLNTPGHRC